MIHLQNGQTIRVRWIQLGRCSQCGHFFADGRSHLALCRAGRINQCGICGEKVHWTALSGHVAAHKM
jgi:hypothetical protein